MHAQMHCNDPGPNGSGSCALIYLLHDLAQEGLNRAGLTKISLRLFNSSP